MPKDRRINSLSSDRSRSSPYPCSSKDTQRYKTHSPLGSTEDAKEWEEVKCPICVEHPHKKPKYSNSSLGSVEDVKEWEEVRCPVCMEHPHNAVLLQCSSYEKGCRPYMCNTSYRHSNCLDQFCKSSVSSPSTTMIQEIPSVRGASHRTREEWLLPGQSSPSESELHPKLSCPLCRGEIYGWTVVEAARQFMNSKARGCSCETCEFSGNYSELRKHARCNHPSVRPSEVDPQRQHDWMRLERARELENLFTLIWSEHERELDRELGFYTMMDLTVEEEEEHGRQFDVTFSITGLNEEEEAVEVEGRSSGDSNQAMNDLNSVNQFIMAIENMFRVDYGMEAGQANRHNNNFRQNNSFGRNLHQRMPHGLDNSQQSNNDFSGVYNLRQNRHDRYPSEMSYGQNNSFGSNLQERMPHGLNNSQQYNNDFGDYFNLRQNRHDRYLSEMSHSQTNFRHNLSETIAGWLNSNRTGRMHQRLNNNVRQNNDIRRSNLMEGMHPHSPWPRRSTPNNDC